MKALIIGSRGQFGSDLVEEFDRCGWETISIDIDRIDIAFKEETRALLGKTKADVVVNTAAMHHVEQCELDPVRAFQVNAAGAFHLALGAVAAGSVLVHVSTDYVFDGSKRSPYVETDAPYPLNVYGVSKVAGEMLIRTNCPAHYIIRTSGLYGKNPCLAKGGLNFVETMIKLSREREEIRVVDDEILTPTSTIEAARQVESICRNRPVPGIYHVTAEGACSWYQFAWKIFNLTGATVKLNRANPGEFPAKVPRPKYSVLENASLKRAGLNMMKPWEDALQEYIHSRSR